MVVVEPFPARSEIELQLFNALCPRRPPLKDAVSVLDSLYRENDSGANDGRAVGMHKSALLRYFETREQIFLRLTADGWREWSPALAAALAGLEDRSPASIARAIASSLAARPLFCDLLAQAPLNLERNVSVEGVRAFKLTTLEEFGKVVDAVRRAAPTLTADDAWDFMAAATSLAGALYQIATPGPQLEDLYRSDPRLAHSILDFEPRLTRMLTGMLKGFAGSGQESA